MVGKRYKMAMVGGIVPPHDHLVVLILPME
jgi:hypothetical protein